jgi:hypothetical protein
MREEKALLIAASRLLISRACMKRRLGLRLGCKGQSSSRMGHNHCIQLHGGVPGGLESSSL